MPELPEVETIRRGLSRLVLDKPITKVVFDTPKSFPNSSAEVRRFLVGASVTTIERRAKVLILELSSGYSLITHLKMTGQLVYDGESIHFGGGHPSTSLVDKLPDKTTRVILSFNDGSKLYFNDQRKFGWMKLWPTAAIKEQDFFKNLGPEPLADNFTWQMLRDSLSRRARSAIKPAIMDQHIIAGIGNIYADESLWSAKINPATPVGALKVRDYRNLHRSIREVLNLSLRKGGSTDRNYVDAEGRRGSYLEFASVFRRESQPCPRCRKAIVKTRLAGRGTHYCPHCQKIPGRRSSI